MQAGHSELWPVLHNCTWQIATQRRDVSLRTQVHWIASGFGTIDGGFSDRNIARKHPQKNFASAKKHSIRVRNEVRRMRCSVTVLYVSKCRDEQTARRPLVSRSEATRGFVTGRCNSAHTPTTSVIPSRIWTTS